MRKSPPIPPPDSTRGKCGFTLIELLVAMTVLALMMSMLAQVLTASMQTTHVSQQQIEAARQARMTLDTLHEDLNNLVIQNGAATVFAANNVDRANPAVTNAQLVFVTHRRGPLGATSPRFMAVAYAVEGTQLTRRYSAVAWNKANLMPEAFKARATTDAPARVDGVIRLTVSLLLDDDEIVPLTASGTWIAKTFNGDAVPENFSALAPADGRADAAKPKVRALIVSVATLDVSSLRLLNGQNLVAALAEPITGKTGFETWNGFIDGGGLGAYPKPVVSSLRLSQQTFPLR